MPTRNRAGLLARLLPSWAEQLTQAPYEVIVADNGSTDQTAPTVREASGRWPHVRVIVEPRPGGARARHAGAVAAQSPLLIFMDDDMRADPSLVAEHMRAHEESPGGVVLGNIVSAPGRHPFDRMMAYIYDGPKKSLAGREPTAQDYWSGNVSLPRDLYFRLGGYSDALAELRCGEDMEFGLRLAAAGVKMRFMQKALTHHHFTERFGARLNRAYRVGVVCAYLKELYPGLDISLARRAGGGLRPRATELLCRALASLMEPFDRGEGVPSVPLSFVYDLGLRTAVGRGMSDYAEGRSPLGAELNDKPFTAAEGATARR